MPRVKKVYEEAPSDWQVIFCSLSIILVAFFVMLCSMATMEQGKLLQVKRSFKGALDIFSGGVLFDEGDGIVVPSPDNTGSNEKKIAAPIYQLLKGKGLEDKVSLKSTSKYVQLSMLDSVLFESGGTTISAEAKPLLRKLALILSEFYVPIRIEGHTDDSPAQQYGFMSNWEISSLRAANIMRYMQREGDFPPQRLTALGFSEYRPFLPNTAAAERERNRRVEIIIPVMPDIIDERGSIIRDAPPSFTVWDLGG